MSHHRWTRPIFVALVLVASWFVVGTSTAQAAKAPEPESGGGIPLAPAGVVPDGTPVWQFVLIAALACLVTVLATLSIQAIQRHAHGHGSGMVRA